MNKSRLSIIIDTEDAKDFLPLTLIDLDNYMQKLNLSYEVLVLSSRKEDLETLKRFSRIIKFAESAEKLTGDVGIFLRGERLPIFEKFNEIISNTHPIKKGGEELIFGSYIDNSYYGKSAKIISMILRLPIKLNVYNCMFAFHMDLASSVMSLRKIGIAFDLELAILSDKLGFKTKQIQVSLQDGFVKRFNYKEMLISIMEAIKIRTRFKEDSIPIYK